MNNFQSQLESEMERRGLKKKPVEKIKPEKKQKIKKEKVKRTKLPKKKKNKPPSKPLPFSFGAFFIASCLGGFIILGLLVWLTLNAEKTAENLISELPTKTAIVNREVDPVITTEDVQPVLRMSPVVSEEAEEIQEAETPTIKPNTLEENNLPLAPLTGLFENSDFGQLPIKNKESGLTPFDAYKKTTNLNPDKPSIAFIVADMGINNKQTEQLISDLPETITFSFSPYAWNVKAFMVAAHQGGHETWLTLPLQTENYPLQDPGPLAILNGVNIKQNQLRLNTLLGKAVGYVGFIAEKDHVFRREDVRTNPAFKEIFDRGLAIIDSDDKSINFVSQLGEQKGYPHAQNNFWLDEDLRPHALNQKLRQALEQARSAGHVIVMLHPYPASIDTVKKFLNSVAAQEFNIVPASTLVKSDE